MKKSITSAGRARRQGGFSILEILIATVMISLLVASGLYYANVGDKAAAVDIAAAKAAIVVRFPEALMTVYAIKQTLENTTAADLINTGSVRTNSPVTWTVGDGATQTKMSISLTFSGSATATAMQTYLSSISDTTMIESAAVDADNAAIVTVTYEL